MIILHRQEHYWTCLTLHNYQLSSLTLMTGYNVRGEDVPGRTSEIN